MSSVVSEVPSRWMRQGLAALCSGAGPYSLKARGGPAPVLVLFVLLFVVLSVAAQDSAPSDLVQSHQAFADRIAILDEALTAAYRQADVPAVAAALQGFLTGGEAEPALDELVAAMKASSLGRSLETLSEVEAAAVDAARQAAQVMAGLHRRIEWCIGNQAVLDAWMAIVSALGGQ